MPFLVLLPMLREHADRGYVIVYSEVRPFTEKADRASFRHLRH